MLAIAFVLGEACATLVAVLSVRSATPPLPDDVAAIAREHGGANETEVRAQDGILLRCEILGDPTKAPVVVLAHGYRRNRRDGDPLAKRLLGAGYAVASFDFRGSGASDGLLTGGGATEGADVEAVVGFLRTRWRVPVHRIGVVAFSMGAVATIQAAATMPKLGAAVLIAPYASLEEAVDTRTRRWLRLPARPFFSPAFWLGGLLLGADLGSVVPERRIAQLSPAPVMLVAGGADWRVPSSAVQRLFAAAAEPRTLEILADLDHDALASQPPELCDRVLAFLATTSLGARTRTERR